MGPQDLSTIGKLSAENFYHQTNLGLQNTNAATKLDIIRSALAGSLIVKMRNARVKVDYVFFLGNQFLQATWQLITSVTRILTVSVIQKKHVHETKGVRNWVVHVAIQRMNDHQMRLKETTAIRILVANATTGKRNVKIRDVLMSEASVLSEEMKYQVLSFTTQRTGAMKRWNANATGPDAHSIKRAQNWEDNAT